MADTPVHLGIYHLERIDPEYGSHIAFVILDVSENQARIRAGYADSGNHNIVWADPAAVTVTFLGWAEPGGEPRIVMSEKLGE